MLKYHIICIHLTKQFGTSVKFAPATFGRKIVSRISESTENKMYQLIRVRSIAGCGISGRRYWSAFNELLYDNLTGTEIAHVHDAAPLIKPLEFQRSSSQATYSVSEVRCNNSDYGDEN